MFSPDGGLDESFKVLDEESLGAWLRTACAPGLLSEESTC